MTQDIEELEQRISAAFGRMDRGLEALARARAAAPLPEVAPQLAQPAPTALAPAAVEAGPQLGAMLRALETAKAAADDWAARYAKLQAQMGEDTLAMAAEITRLTAELDSLRAGAAPNVAPSAPDHEAEIDELTARLAAQEAELETLRAARAADASELGELIAQLAPLVEEASHV